MQTATRARPDELATGTPALSLRGLRRDYDERPVLRDVSLELEQGATLAVIGANGAGKSTLLRILATLLRPSAGAVHVLGASLPREAWKVRGRLGYLGHEPLLYRELTVRENLELNARLHRIPDPDARIAAAARARGHRPPRRGSGAQPVGRHPAAGGDLPRAGPRAGARCCWTSRAPTSTWGPPASSTSCSARRRAARALS